MGKFFLSRFGGASFELQDLENLAEFVSTEMWPLVFKGEGGIQSFQSWNFNSGRKWSKKDEGSQGKRA